MINHLQRISSFFIILFSLSIGAQTKLTTGATPNWVMVQDYNVKPEINPDDIYYGVLQLLIDDQIHLKNEAQYKRTVKKITENVGVQEASSISINYDPSYQSLILHKVEVIRNGKKINKLNIKDFQTIRKESNAESFIYDGSLDAIVNLPDIRKDDIIDISYTISGFNPIHDGHYSGGFQLNDFQPVGKVHALVISPKPIRYKMVNTEKKPTESNSSGFYTYQWISENVKEAEFEMNTPMHQFSYENVFFSDFKDWHEVVTWALPLYENKDLSPALRTKVNAIKSAYDEEGDRILAALRFVQNEIRYLGLEDGIGSYKPFSPNQVFDQRYGDCKDKSYLLIAMLNAMDIEAYPVLINTVYGPSLHQFLPSPKFFDHVTVKVIDSKNNHLFYDPTIANQGGLHTSTYFPDYAYGLVIKEDTYSLEKIENNSSNLVEVFDVYDLNGIGNDAVLTVYTKYYEQQADVMRSRIKASSISSMKDEFKSFYANVYEGIEILEDPTYDDDTLRNELTIYEKYKIEKAWVPVPGDEQNISVSFYSYNLTDIIMQPDEKKRKTDYALYYPAARKHNITVKLPTRWNIIDEDYSINSENFYYNFESKTNPSKDVLYLDYFYKSQTPTVKLTEFDTYYEDMKKLENSSSYMIYIDKDEATNPLNFSQFNTNKKQQARSDSWIPIIFGFLIIVAVIVVYVIRARRL